MKSDYGSSKVLGFVAACLMFLPILFIVTVVYRDSLSYILQSAGGSFDLQVRLAKGRQQNAPSETSEVAIDKFLGGLLASYGINDSSCLSRFQSTSYRRPSPHQPSPYLVQKLRKYETLHRKCGPNTHLYKKTPEKLKSGHSNVTDGCNYMIWIPISGLGNRILTLSSAFLYSLLTDRVLLIDSGKEMSNLFCEPFPESSWLLPLDFPIMQNRRTENRFGNLIRNKSLNGPDTPTFSYLHLAHDYHFFDKLFFCEEGQLLLKGIPWLTLRSDVYFAPSLFLIPSFEEELTQLFPNKETVFHHIGRYLFHPSNSVWRLVLRYYEAYLAEADDNVGIQLRIFDDGPGPFRHILDQILSCSLNQTLLPQVASQEGKISMANTTPKRKAVLMTSLSSWYSEEMRSMYWEQPTVTGEIVSVFQPSHEGHQQTGRQMHDMKAWAEVYLLSLSDTLVTSSRSTFGYVAQGLGGLRPWILFTPENQTVPQPACGRAMSMEPCFHDPPSYDCKAKRNVDMGAFVPYLRHCEDVPSGVKLVDVPSL